VREKKKKTVTNFGGLDRHGVFLGVLSPLPSGVAVWKAMAYEKEGGRTAEKMGVEEMIVCGHITWKIKFGYPSVG